MKRCIAYRAAKNCVHAWKPCKGRAGQSGFCRSHLRAICGIYLGLCVHGFPERMNGHNPASSAKAARSNPQ